VDEDPNGNEIAAGELIVTYEDKLITSQAAEDTPQEVEAEIEEELPEIQAQLLSFPDVKNEQDQEAREQTLEEKKETIETDPNVEAVDYNYIVKALGQQYQALMTPNDQYYNLQWGYPKIKAPEAWDVTQGSNQTKVAVVDTGVQAGHPDLQGKVVGQKDFVDNDDTANDGTGHGTHVAGTVGAVTNNTTGVAGTCPSCSILAARVLDSTGVGSTFSVVQGINWSRTNGAKVINLSLGAPVPSPTVLENAVNNAWNAGLVVVAGAGNSGDRHTLPGGLYKLNCCSSYRPERQTGYLLHIWRLGRRCCARRAHLLHSSQRIVRQQARHEHGYPPRGRVGWFARQPGENQLPDP
jgi:thermitase